jgi:hypothetical protein
MESSGRYCEGRDVSECFDTPDSAEAGLFQTSYADHRLTPALDAMISRYKSANSACLLSTFSGSMTCQIKRSHNPQCPTATSDVVGFGPGADWQRLTKTCPAFATEFASVVIRRHGGLRGEFNPIRKMEAEVRPECDAMLHSVQNYVEHHPYICPQL